MKSETLGDIGKVIKDDGARHAETLTRNRRMPVFNTNKLMSCEDVTFTQEHKQQALDLLLDD